MKSFKAIIILTITILATGISGLRNSLKTKGVAPVCPTEGTATKDAVASCTKFGQDNKPMAIKCSTYFNLKKDFVVDKQKTDVALNTVKGLVYICKCVNTFKLVDAKWTPVNALEREKYNQRIKDGTHPKCT